MEIKGRYHNGVIHPLAPMEVKEGQIVLISIPEGELLTVDDPPRQFDALDDLLEECSVHVGIPDLAHQHDHYLYGTPKK